MEEDMVLDLLLVHSLCSSGATVSGRNSGREEYVTFRDSVGERVEEDVVLGLLLVQSLCCSGPWVRVAETAVGRSAFHSETVLEKDWKRTWCWVCCWCSLCVPLVLGSKCWKN